MSTNIARTEYDMLTAFQKELHEVTSKDEEYVSTFYREFSRTPWYSLMHSKLQSTVSDEEVTYTVNTTFHYLLYVYKRRQLPAMKVSDKFKKSVQICWCHNVGTNDTISGQLKFDDDTPQTIDDKWFDIHSQFYMRAGFRDNYNICVGNLKGLEEWTTQLDEYTTNVVQPYYFSDKAVKALKLFYFGTQTNIHFRYRFRNEIKDLLRMRAYYVKEGIEGWHEISVNFKYLEGYPDDRKLKVPEMWGRYAYITPDELDVYKGCSVDEHPITNIDINNPLNALNSKVKSNNNNSTAPEKTYKFKEQIIYIEDIVTAESPNAQALGTKVTIDLSGTTPAKSIFWVAQSVTAAKNRNFSNYTTNTDNLYLGWNPINKVSLHYGGLAKFDNMDTDHFSAIEPRHFPSAPSEAGYNALTIAYDSTSLDADVGTVMSTVKGKLSLVLGDTDPKLKSKKRFEEKDYNNDEPKIEEADGGPDEKYIVYVRMLVMKKMVVRRLVDNAFKIIV